MRPSESVDARASKLCNSCQVIHADSPSQDSPVIICPRCIRETVPKLKSPSWQRDVLRAAADGMIEPEDPQAERIKRKKDRQAIRRAISTAIATKDLGLVKILLSGKNAPLTTADDGECLECLRLQAKAAA
jgi:hypothetical protein